MEAVDGVLEPTTSSNDTRIKTENGGGPQLEESEEAEGSGSQGAEAENQAVDAGGNGGFGGPDEETRDEDLLPNLASNISSANTSGNHSSAHTFETHANDSLPSSSGPGNSTPVTVPPATRGPAVATPTARGPTNGPGGLHNEATDGLGGADGGRNETNTVENFANATDTSDGSLSLIHI